MKKLFMLIFTVPLAVCSFANNDLPDISEIDLAVKQIALTIPESTFPISNKSHKDNTIELTVRLQAVNISDIHRPASPEERYWANSREWEEWRIAHPANYEEGDEAAEEAYTEAVNQFIRDYEAGLEEQDKVIKQIFTNRIKYYAESTRTNCKMVRISSYWLLGSSSCLPAYIRQNPQINSETKEDVAFDVFMNSEREYSSIYLMDYIEADGVTIDPVKNMFIGNGLVLIHLTSNQVNRMESLSVHHTNVLTPLLSIKPNHIYVEGKAVENFEVNGTKIITNKRTSSGTPMFAENGEYREFLLGFNAASYESYPRGRGTFNRFHSNNSKEYQLLTTDMKNFIEQTISTVTPAELEEVRSLK